jgi:excisionase family DNA binding protein
MSIEDNLNAATTLLTFEQVRTIFNLSERTVRRWVKTNKLKSYRLGGRLRFDPSDVGEALRERSSR